MRCATAGEGSPSNAVRFVLWESDTEVTPGDRVAKVADPRFIRAKVPLGVVVTVPGSTIESEIIDIFLIFEESI